MKWLNLGCSYKVFIEIFSKYQMCSVIANGHLKKVCKVVPIHQVLRYENDWCDITHDLFVYQINILGNHLPSSGIY